MGASEQLHVGFVGQVRAISNEDKRTKDGPSVLLELFDPNGDTIEILTVAVSINPLYQRPVVNGSVKTATPPEALPLVRLLPATVVDGMLEAAGPARSPELSLAFIQEYLVESKRDFFFSLQLYRDGVGHVTWEVDAILEVP